LWCFEGTTPLIDIPYLLIHRRAPTLSANTPEAKNITPAMRTRQSMSCCKHFQKPHDLRNPSWQNSQNNPWTYWTWYQHATNV